MRRRTFIAGLGSTAAWPVLASAQQTDRMRRIGVLIGYDESDPEGKARLSGFTQGLSELGWTDNRNLRIDVLWAIDNVDRVRALAKELVALQPDVILGGATPATAALQLETRDDPANITVGFLQGLKEAGYVEGQNVAIEYRWAENQLDRLPALAADLVRRRVAVIVTRA